MDALAEERSWLTPYNYVQNSPIIRIDPTGNLDDNIDIDKATGKITIEETDAPDVVRLIENGNVVDQYEYGADESFSTENIMFEGEHTDANGKNPVDGQTITFPDEDNAQKFFLFAGQSDVEFGKLDIISPNGKETSIVTTSNEATDANGNPAVLTLTRIVSVLSAKGYTGVTQSHTHPNHNIPSGHYDYEEGNSNSLTPMPGGGGDAGNARWTRAQPGFENTRFYMYYLPTNSRTYYDGESQARRRKFRN